jgi:hypothetical protein
MSVLSSKVRVIITSQELDLMSSLVDVQKKTSAGGYKTDWDFNMAVNPT